MTCCSHVERAFVAVNSSSPHGTAEVEPGPVARALACGPFSAKSVYAVASRDSGRRSYAYSPTSDGHPQHAPASAQKTGHHDPRVGGLVRHLPAPLWPTVLPLPPRRTAAYRPAPHLQGTGQDTLRLCPQGIAAGSPYMARQTSTSQTAAPRDPSTDGRAAASPGPVPEAQGGAAVIAGRALVQTVGHFFPQFNAWLDRLPDTRAAETCTYATRFLAWWGLHLYLLQLGSRRQLDFELRDGGPQVLANLNRLADTRQTTLPVHDTLDHFIGHVRQAGWEQLRRRCVGRLLRMKALDAARLLGHPVLLLDATGLLCFHRRHCPHCLTQRHGQQMLYFHHVLEAKLLGPGGVVVSLDSEFIDNADAADTKGKSAEQIKQDCELKAVQRLLPRIKKDYPQLQFVLALDNLYACGTLFALAQELGWSFVVTFKEGRTPALWREYQALRPACPENTLRRAWDDRMQEFRWVNRLAYEDSEGRQWQLNALECTE